MTEKKYKFFPVTLVNEPSRILTISSDAKLIPSFLLMKNVDWSSYEAIINIVKKNDDILELVYRGQKDTKWELSTTLERSVFDLSNASLDKIQFEAHCLSRLNSLCKDPFQKNHESDFFAFLQHHNAPTRLLDFTRNIHNAMLFALDPSDFESAVYAIDIKPILRALIPIKSIKSSDESESIKGTRYYLGKERERMIFNACLHPTDDKLFTRPISILAEILTPFPRLTDQEGLFLYPTNFSKTFQENLFQYNRKDYPDEKFPENRWKECQSLADFEHEIDDYQKNHTNQGSGQSISIKKELSYLIVKFIISKESKKTIYQEIKKTQNKTMENLYPDEVGYMKQLHYQLCYEDHDDSKHLKEKIREYFKDFLAIYHL